MTPPPTAALSNEEAGVATIEFAAVAVILCALMLGLVDFGLAFWGQMQVANAAQAGANYVMANGYTSEEDTRNAATHATNFAVSMDTPATMCGCPTSTGVKPAALGTYPTCGSSCSGVSGGSGNSVPYVSITASASYSTIFGWPGFGHSLPLSATAFAPN